MRIIIAAALLLLLFGCVQIPEEELAPPVQEEAPPAPRVNISAPVPNITQPLPLAPLPEGPKNKRNTSSIAYKPKAVQTNSSSQQPSGPQQSQYAWTTESVSIAEGETKIIYVKK